MSIPEPRRDLAPDDIADSTSDRLLGSHRKGALLRTLRMIGLALVVVAILLGAYLLMGAFFPH